MDAFEQAVAWVLLRRHDCYLVHAAASWIQTKIRRSDHVPRDAARENRFRSIAAGLRPLFQYLSRRSVEVPKIASGVVGIENRRPAVRCSAGELQHAAECIRERSSGGLYCFLLTR